MWAQLIQMRLKPGKDMTEVDAQLRAAEQPGSGLVRSIAMRDQKDPTLRPGLRPEGVALRAVRLTGSDEPGTFGAWLMTSPSGTGIF